MADARGLPPLTRRLADEHAALAETFGRHQHALLGGDLPGALAALEDFAAGLARHIRTEEGEVLPRYAAAGLFPRGGAPEVFASEHRRIEAALRELLGAVRGMSEGGGRAEVLRALERGMRFKAVLEHHTLREETLLFPAIDGIGEGEP